MSHRALWEVSRWEFLRFVKPGQQVLGLVMTFGILLGITLFGKLRDDPAVIEVAVIGAQHVPTLGEREGRFELRRHEAGEEPALRSQIEDRDLAGLLVLHDDGSGELFTRQSPGWRSELEHELNRAAQLYRIQASGIEPEALAALQAPFPLRVVESAPRAGSAERIVAVSALVLMLIGLFGGIGYIFSSVTGEKNNRLSEQVISAIPVQSWIDGKILGLAAVSLVMILNTVVAVGLWMGARWAVWGDAPPFPTSIESPGLLALVLAIITLGYLFWFTFLTAVAAMVDDPHNSTRSQLLFLPMLAAVPAFMALGDPGATWVRLLAVLPPTSTAVMPARLLLTDVPAWEVVLAVGLLAGLTLALRRAAGKVFRLAMLMYGKEPSWSEVRRWIREA